MTDETLFSLERLPPEPPDEDDDFDQVEGLTSLYRLYDGTDTLLYVGIAGNVGRRLNEHSKEKSWWRGVNRISVEHYDTRLEALSAESAAIRGEHPLFNVAGTGSRSHRWCQPLALTFPAGTVVVIDPDELWCLAKAIEAAKEEHLVEDRLDWLWLECAKRYGGAVLRGYDVSDTERAMTMPVELHGESPP